VLLSWEYKEGQNIKPIPGWCTQYFAIGHSLAEYQSTERRFVVGIAVPTRAYVAAFLSAGYVVKRAMIPLTEEIERHFKFLEACPIGTAVFYRKNGLVLKGVFEGCRTERILDKLVSRVAIRVSNRSGGNLTHLVQQADCLDVEVRESERVNLPKNQAGSVIRRNQKFLRVFLNDKAEAYSARSRLDCTLVGSVSIFEAELKNLLLRRADDTHLTGSLQELLRVRCFMGKGQAYRSDAVSASTLEVEAQNTPIVVFDGSTGFLRLRESWSTANCVVVLDRTESRFSEAAETINIARSQNKRADLKLIKPTLLPVGVELIAFEQDIV